jgi:hypothetical protein
MLHESPHRNEWQEQWRGPANRAPNAVVILPNGAIFAAGKAGKRILNGISLLILAQLTREHRILGRPGRPRLHVSLCQGLEGLDLR